MIGNSHINPKRLKVAYSATKLLCHRTLACGPAAASCVACFGFDIQGCGFRVLGLGLFSSASMRHLDGKEPGFSVQVFGKRRLANHSVWNIDDAKCRQRKTCGTR